MIEKTRTVVEGSGSLQGKTSLTFWPSLLGDHIECFGLLDRIQLDVVCILVLFGALSTASRTADRSPDAFDPLEHFDFVVSSECVLELCGGRESSYFYAKISVKIRQERADWKSY